MKWITVFASLLLIGCSSKTEEKVGLDYKTEPPKVLIPARIEISLARSQSLSSAEPSLLDFSQRLNNLAGVAGVTSTLTSIGTTYQVGIEDSDSTEQILAIIQSWLADLPKVEPAPVHKPHSGSLNFWSPLAEHNTLIPIVPERSRTLLPQADETRAQDIHGLAAALRELPDLSYVAIEGTWQERLQVKIEHHQLNRFGLQLEEVSEFVEPALLKWSQTNPLNEVLDLAMEPSGRVKLADIASIDLERCYPEAEILHYPEGALHVLRTPNGNWDSLETQLSELLPLYGFRSAYKLHDESDHGRSIVSSAGGEHHEYHPIWLDFIRLHQSETQRLAQGSNVLVRTRNRLSQGSLQPTIQITTFLSMTSDASVETLASQWTEIYSQQPSFLTQGIAQRDASMPARRSKVTYLSNDLDQLVRIERSIRAALASVGELRLANVLAPQLGPDQLTISFNDDRLAEHGVSPNAFIAWLTDQAQQISAKAKIHIGFRSRPTAHQFNPETFNEFGDSVLIISVPRPRTGTQSLDALLKLPVPGVNGTVTLNDIASVEPVSGVAQISHVGAHRGIQLCYDIASSADAREVHKAARRALETVDLPENHELVYSAPHH